MHAKHTILNVTVLVSMAASLIVGGTVKLATQAETKTASSQPAQTGGPVNPADTGTGQMRTTTQAMREAAAARLQISQKGVSANYAGVDKTNKLVSPLAANSNPLATMAAPNSAPDYFGMANWANSPLPTLDPTGAITPGTGMRKFVDGLPGLCQVSGVNDLGQCIPLGVPDTATFTGSDYYEIGLVEYREQLHKDLPAVGVDASGNAIGGTRLRGYVQLYPLGTTSTAAPTGVALTRANGLTMDIMDSITGQPRLGYFKPQYLGPTILAHGCDPHAANAVATNCVPTPVRIKFTNLLPTGPAGNLYIPYDTTYMGAGEGPVCVDGTPATPTSTCVRADYTQNRATLHLHGGATPWISDGTPHQWTAPAGEATFYAKGASVAYVPDMWFDANGALIPACAGQTTCATTGATNDPGLGSLTFYWTNQQSGRLMFYHDHAYGETRLNVYAGEAAGYLLVDKTVEDALAAATVPGTTGTALDVTHMVPMIIQDKTFVPDNGEVGGQLANTDPTWDLGTYGGKGSLWYTHVYMPNQNPADVTGANAFGRWDYGPWFWPPQNPATYVPQGQPYQCTSAAYPAGSPPAFPPLMCPGTPTPAGTPESFMDTPVVNGTAYPTLTVDPTAYRFQILNAANDRTMNLGLYMAEPLSVAVTAGGSGYTAVPTVSFTPAPGDTTGGGAAATAILSGGSVTSLTFTNPGAGYATIPNVAISGDGTGATATATIDSTTNTVNGLTVTNIGTGYTYATVAIDPPAGCVAPTVCTTATATANITPSGSVIGITVTNPGTGWTAAPTVVFTNAAGDTTGAGAAAVASINTEVKMVDAVPHTAASTLKPCASPVETSGAMLALGAVDASGNPLNGTGLAANCWPSTWPVDGRDGGVPDPLTVGPPIIQIGTEGGLLPAPVLIPSTPVGYEYNRRSITVLNIFTHGLLMGPAERADVVIDFSKYAGKTLIVYNDSPAPVPAFDPRWDYYTGDPDMSSTGGAPSTMPGYGPNTRTIMQIKVAATAAGGLPAIPFSLSALNAALPNIFAASQETVIVPEKAYPATNGGSANDNYLRIQDTSLTSWVGGGIGSLTLLNGGLNYASAPTVTFTGGGGTGATASVAFSGATVNSVTVTNSGIGYSTPPTVTFSGGGGTGATGTAVLTRIVNNINVTNSGSGYTTAPTVTISGGGGSGALATASITGMLNTITMVTRGSGYTAGTTVTFTGGGGSGAAGTANLGPGGRINSITITNRGTGYTSAPTITITGTGTGATATATVTRGVNSVTVTANGTGYTSTPSVTFAGGGGTGATATAVLTGIVNNILITNAGSGYTSPPSVLISGGGGLGATATATYLPGTVTSLTLTNSGTGFTSAPTVTFVGGGTPTTPASAVPSPPVTQLLPKTIQELFTLDYGRMNATLGVELPFTNFLTQTTIPYGYVDPPTELFQDGEMQIWKITHNGVDTHFIHFHLFNVQVINRVGWDGAIKPPDANEMSFKDTVRMNPLEDIIVALRPIKQTLPWQLPNSVRPLDVTQPVGAAMMNEFTNVDPTNQPATVTNALVNFGFEYVWHCHILGHEENDMMRAMILAIPPLAASNLTTSTQTGTRAVTLTWVDNSLNETGFTVQRSTNGVTWTSIATVPGVAGLNNTVTYRDTTVARRTSYTYRVIANNLVGYTQTYAAPAVGYPTLSADSAPSNTANVTTNNSIFAFIFANSIQPNLAGWAGVVGNVQAVAAAAMGPAGGALGMAAIVGNVAPATVSAAQPAYVFDTSPSGVTTYDASFYFSPNGSASGDDPVDIFVGLDQNAQPAFGIQFQKEASEAYEIRSWVSGNGDRVYSEWATITNSPHKLEAAWKSGSLSLYADDNLAATLAGSSSDQKLSEVLLGAVSGLSSSTSGTLYFDEFTSSQLNGVQFNAYIPVVTH